jgi:hypothetical protein
MNKPAMNKIVVGMIINVVINYYMNYYISKISNPDCNLILQSFLQFK